MTKTAAGHGVWKIEREEEEHLRELIALLAANPNGLRRWSLMRQMRRRCESAGRETTPKFECDIERVLRRHCAEDMICGRTGKSWDELFYRPKDRAGEVWAVNKAVAETWIDQANGYRSGAPRAAEHV